MRLSCGRIEGNGSRIWRAHLHPRPRRAPGATSIRQRRRWKRRKGAWKCGCDALVYTLNNVLWISEADFSATIPDKGVRMNARVRAVVAVLYCFVPSALAIDI